MLAHELAYSRPATPDEVGAWLAFIERHKREIPDDAEGATKAAVDTEEVAADPWQALCRVVFSSNEFVYVE